jgi:hypothetical protein
MARCMAFASVAPVVSLAPVASVGCTQSEMRAIEQDLSNMGSQVLADILAGKGYQQVLADVGQGGVALLVTVIQFIIGDPNATPATRSACAPYLARAQVELAAQRKAAP